MREKLLNHDPIRKPRAKENLKWDLRCQMPLSSNPKVSSIDCTLRLEPPDGAQVQLLKKTKHQGLGGAGDTEPAPSRVISPSPALSFPACISLCPLIFAPLGLLLFPAYRFPHSQKQGKNP